MRKGKPQMNFDFADDDSNGEEIKEDIEQVRQEYEE